MTLTNTPIETEEQPSQRDRRFANRRIGPAVKGRHIFVGVALLGLLLVVVSTNFHTTYVAPLQEPMVRVNDVVFTLGDYVARLRALDAEGRLIGQPANFSTDPFKLLEDLVSEELIRQGSPRAGVVVGDAEITAALKTKFGAVLQEQEKLTDAELDKQFQELLTQRLNNVNLSEPQYRTLVRNGLLHDKLRDKLENKVPAVAEQIRLEGFKTQDQQAAQQLQQRWKSGTDLVAITREATVQQESRDSRGDIGWLPHRALDPGVDDVLWKLAHNTISDPFYANPGFWVVRVIDGPEVRAVEGTARDKLKDRALADWLDEERQANTVLRYFDSKRYDYVIDKVREYVR